MMIDHGWSTVYGILKKVARELPRPTRRFRFSDALIVAMFLWAVGHDRPMCWACDRRHYGRQFHPRWLPSISQFSRRLRTDRCRAILTRVYEELAEVRRGSPVCFLDGRAFPVGPCSKDADARAGRVYGGFARGYKLHSLVSEDRRVLCWAVTPLPVAETRVAMALVEHAQPSALVLADGNFDSGPLYDAVEQTGGHLITPVPLRAGRGHHRRSPARLAAIAAWRGIAGYVYRDRIGVEQCYGHLSASGGGLAPLPSWVRTLPRVRRWIGAKLILHHARLKTRGAVA
jgi:hypothetical protein